MSSLLNPNYFWNIAFLTGACMAIFAGLGGPIEINVKGNTLRLLPRISRASRPRYFFTGLALMLISVFMVAATNWGGIRDNGDSSGGNSTTPAAAPLSITFTAMAATQNKPVAEFKLVQNQVVVPGVFGGRLAVYIGEVRLVGSSNLIIFKTDERWDAGARFSYEDMKRRIPGQNIIAEGNLSSGQSIRFGFEGKQYNLTGKLKWYVVGEDFAEIKIFEE
ncbi:MAG TPA: hypothetical protein VID27_06915 [Blastocatellia bacterium]|jgi:hypothetical protein